MSANTQLTNCADLDVGNIMFSNPETKSIPNTPISYKRINILYKNNDGSIGDLIIPTEQLFSFGLQENTDMASGKINGIVSLMSLESYWQPMVKNNLLQPLNLS